jgi:ethanolamine utilization protein EutA
VEARKATQHRGLAEERIEILSAGVDIGSATSHLVFSRLLLEKFENRYVTVSRQIEYESPVLLTPYDGPATIDSSRLQGFINAAYSAAGITHEDVHTGALILTGVALSKMNSRLIADVFARDAGKFVAVTAGDNMEAVMAARGSGALALSNDRHARLLHIDIGGGTSKLAICVDGTIEQTAALDVGARLLVIDADGVVERLEEPGRRIGESLGIDLSVGSAVDGECLRRMALFMAGELLAAAPLDTGGRTDSELLRGPRLAPEPPVQAVSFSGGVAEYIYGRQDERFGDLGHLLATALKEGLADASVDIWPLSSGIRATVIGASQYTMQLSGSTIHLSAPSAGLLRNVRVVAPAFVLDENLSTSEVCAAVREAFIQFDLLGTSGPLALAFSWDGMATHARLSAFAAGIAEGLSAWGDQESPLVLVCDDDVGGLVGRHVTRLLGPSRPVISVDCIGLENFDFIDVGDLLPGSGAVPVVIKSLAFPQ